MRMSWEETMPDKTPPKQTDEFYVGYLPMPDGHRQFVSTLILTLLIWSIGMGTIIVITMRDPGIARWETGSMKTWSGTLIEHPYPMLIPDDKQQSDQQSEQPAALFVVSMGKRGAHDRLAPYFGQHVTLAGYELNRDGRHLIELDIEPDAIKPDQSPPADINNELKPIEHTTLVGEIVDGKCYLGAMKPGDGMGHQACAVLCVKGGLPPMFVADTPEGDHIYYLLLIDGSTRYSDDIYAMLGRPVQIEADITNIHGIPVLLANASSITPVTP